MNLIQMVKEQALKRPNKVFAVYEKEKKTFSQFYSDILSFAGGLRRSGIKKGDRVALLMNNSIEFITAYFGIIAAGGVVVPINIFLKAEEIEFIAADCGVKAVITTPDFTKTVSAIRLSKLDKLEAIISTGVIEGVKTVPYAGMFEPGTKEEPVIGSEDIAVIIYTSGTTGFPKGAMLSHRNLVSDTENCKDIISMSDKDVMMAFLPMFHSYSFTANVMISLCCGCKLVIVKSIQPFAKVIKNLLLHRVSVFVSIPQIYTVLSDAKIPFYVFLLNPMRVAISGGASLPIETFNKFQKRFKVPLVEGYGLSEAAPICTLNPLRGARKAGSIGLPINNVLIKIRDEKGNELGVETEGEITVKGDNVMAGYYNNPEATKEVLKDGWLYTGDLAKKDKDGYIFILDRKKDMIISNGMNIYPREVEEVFYRHPDVADVSIVGLKNKAHGEVPFAVVVLKEGARATESELKKYAREHVANYKVPHRIEFWKELPRNSTGKVEKKSIRKKVNDEHNRVNAAS